MIEGLEIVTEADPSPIARILATTLRRSARDPKRAAAMRKASGNVALRSTVDPQAATIRFDRGKVVVVSGVAPDAHVVIATDVNAMSDEQPPKPKVTGAGRHLRLALTAARVLDPPYGSWQDEGTIFFGPVFADPHAPRGVTVTCTTDGSTHTYGDAEHVEYEIVGTRHALMNVLGGNTVFGQDLLDGKLYAVGSLTHLAILTGRSLAVMMGA